MSNETRTMANLLDALNEGDTAPMDLDQIPLDATRLKSWGGGGYGTAVEDQGTGLWNPEKRAMVELHNLKNLFYSESWVFIVCMLYAKKVARQPLTIARESFSGGKRVFTPRDDHPLLKSFQRPNQEETFRLFLTRLVAELMLMGNAVCWQMRYAKGMMMLPSELIQLEFDNRTRLKGYRFQGSAASEDIQLPGLHHADFFFPREQAIHVKLPNLNSMLWGLSPWIPGRRSVLFDRYSTEYLLNFYWNQGNAGMVLAMDKEANETNAVRLIKSYENALTGRRNMRRTMLLPKGVTATNVQQKLAEQELGEHVMMRREEIIALLHVPPHEVGLQKNGSLGSDETKSALKNFWEAGILPVQELIADAFTEAWRRTGDLAEDELFQFDNSDVHVLQENALEKAKTANEMLRTKTINEVRKEVWELEGIEGGDVLEAQANKPDFGGGAPGAPGLPGQPPPAPGAEPPAPKDQQPPPPAKDPGDEPLPPAPMEKAEVDVDKLRPDENGAPPERKAGGAYNTRKVATVAVFHQEEMLMGLRNDNGRWTCPGGHLDPGEEPRAGAARELAEETGLEIDPAQLKELGAQEVQNEQGETITVHAFQLDLPVRPEGFDPQGDPDGEVKGWKWIKTAHGLPKTVRDNLHVPMERNVLMDKAELKGSKGYVRANKLWFTKRAQGEDAHVGTTQEAVLDTTLDLMADFAAAAVAVAKKHVKAPEEGKSKTKAKEDDKKPSALPPKAQIKRDLDRAFSQYEEKWVDENVKTLSSSVEFGYGLQMQVPFNLPDPQEADTLRRENAEGRKELLASRLLKSFAGIKGTTSDQILDVIADGVSKSQTLSEITKAIIGKLANVENAGTRAQTIARTETLTAVSLGQWAATQDVQKMVPGSRLMWVSAGDNRVRDSHAEVDGDEVEVGKKFKNGLLFPRDPAGEASEVINCFPASTLAEALGVERTFQRFYRGPMVTVNFKSGAKLTGTPNHPALTAKGWVGLGSLVKGQKVFKASGVNSLAPGNDQPEHVKAGLGEQFQLAARAASGVRSAGRGGDFHGDGTSQDVDIVNVQRGLRARRNTEATEKRQNRGLSGSDLAQCIGLGQGGDDHAARRIGPTHGGIGAGNLGAAALQIESSPLAALGLASSTGAASDGGHAAENRGSADAKHPGELKHGDALIDVETDEVVNVEIQAFAGHVYNLQTEGGWYLADGFVVHNCRCTSVIVPPEDGLDDAGINWGGQDPK